MPLTANQERVFTALREAERPLSAYAVLDKVRGAGLSAPTQVYRALDRLLAQGLVHRLDSLNAYVSCTHAGGCQHGFTAFAICDGCGHVDEFVDDSLSRGLGRWMKRSAFSMKRATIELHGECAACSGLRAAHAG